MGWLVGTGLIFVGAWLATRTAKRQRHDPETSRVHVNGTVPIAGLVYLKQIRPVVEDGATAMDRIFGRR